MHDRHPKRKRSNRRGVALLVALGCLAIASVLLVSISRVSAARRQATRHGAWRVQAEWLAESGVERAAAQLKQDADYRGETWLLPAEQLGGDHEALVVIEIAPDAEQPRHRLVSVRADYPNHPMHRASRNKQVAVRLPEEMEQ